MAKKHSNKLKIVIIQEGFDQKKLADESGVSYRVVNALCNSPYSEINVTLNTLRKIASALGKTVDYVFEDVLCEDLKDKTYFK